MWANSSDSQPRSGVLKRSGAALGLTLWVAVAFFVAGLAVFALEQLLVWLGVPLLGLNSSLLSTIEAAAVFALMLVLVLAAPKLFRRALPTLKQLGLDRLPSWKDIGLGLLGLVPYGLLAWLFLVVVTALAPGFDLAQEQDVGFKHLSQHYEYMLAFFTLVVVAPVAEETVFRGYLYGKLRGLIGVAGAIILSGICFAALHGQWNVAVNVFALSIVMCGLRELTGSIWASIILHMVKNGVAYYFLFISPITM